MKLLITAFAFAVMLPSTQQSFGQHELSARAETFVLEHPATDFFHDRSDRITRVYGKSFSHGNSAAESADSFLQEWAGIWGCEAANFIPVGPWGDGIHQQPIMFDDQAGVYRFTGVGYTQTVSGIPVYGSRITVLVRNEHNFPAVHVTADLRDLGSWELPSTRPNTTALTRTLVRSLGTNIAMTKPSLFVFAGMNDKPTKPHLAFVTEVSRGSKADDTFQKWLYVVDAVDGTILYIEDRILMDIDGTVSAVATQSSGADECDIELSEPLPHATITGGGQSVFADGEGNFTLPTSGSDDVTVTSAIEGQWFYVQNQASSNSSISSDTPPDGSVNIVHNADNTSATYRAEVNAYIESNDVRDFVLAINPDFPTIGTQEDWPVNVNINDSCNAYYDYSSINFYLAGGGCNNTAFSVIVHHEYGHHLVAVAGSGQGEYGEGMGDVMGVLLTGDSATGRGFYQGNCDSGIRDADNNCQYSETSCSSCGGEIHSCGQLISGCVWDIREQLMSHYPNGDEIIADIAVNSIMLHNGSGIDAAIPIDYLTLDDDDDDVGNGTPHYTEIAYGFNLHGIYVEQLDFLFMDLVGELPGSLNPSGGDTVVISIANGISEYQEGSATIFFTDGGGIIEMYLLVDQGDGTYLFEMPPVPCGNEARFWFTASTVDGQLMFFPPTAPEGVFTIVSANEYIVSIDDDFEEDLGWVVTGTSTSPWERGVPQQEGGNWIPHADFDGSGQCYLTDNQGAGGQHDLEGTTILTSPTLDASSGGTLSWAYWLSERNNNPHGPEDSFQLLASVDGGNSWEVVRNYTDYLPQGGWRSDSLVIEVGGEIEPTESLLLRFVASDEPPDNRIEAGVDAVRSFAIVCDVIECPADTNGDGVVDVVDLLAIVGSWGESGGPADINGDGAIDVLDILAVIDAWGSCQ